MGIISKQTVYPFKLFYYILVSTFRCVYFYIDKCLPLFEYIILKQFSHFLIHNF